MSKAIENIKHLLENRGRSLYDEGFGLFYVWNHKIIHPATIVIKFYRKLSFKTFYCIPYPVFKIKSFKIGMCKSRDSYTVHYESKTEQETLDFHDYLSAIKHQDYLQEQRCNAHRKKIDQLEALEVLKLLQ